MWYETGLYRYDTGVSEEHRLYRYSERYWKLRKQTNKINRKYCRDKLEREGLWMRLTKDKRNTPAASTMESLTGILKDNPDFDKAKLEDLRERYCPIDG